MKRTFHFSSLLLILLFPLLLACHLSPVNSTSQPVSHEKWTELLQKHVTANGWVDYLGFQKDSVALESYLDVLRSNHPNDANWTRDEQLAYWINAYNAFTVKLVADHYPVESIKDIKRGIPFVNTVWDIKFIEIEGEKYDLNNIEHGIIRKKFDEPRIHFAINCASVSCPKLANFAYLPEKLTDQLDRAARDFINDPSRNVIHSSSKAELSKIFSWFKSDFTKDQSLIDFVNRYANLKLTSNASIKYLDYNWAVNDLRD